MATSHFLGRTPVLAATAYFALALGARTASATSQCPLRTQPTELEPSWADAANRARSVLASNGGDCKDVVLEVDAGRARLTYTTLDGRQATRWLESPGALEPALAALEVTLSPEERTRNEPAAPPARSPAPAKPASEPNLQRATPPHVLVHAQAGARLGGSELVLAPALAAGALLTVGHLELGVGVQWEPAYLTLEQTESPSSRLTSLGANIAAGRRNPIGKGRAIVTGARVSVAVLHQQWWLPEATAETEDEDEGEHEGERAQARLGAYAGPIIPISKSARLRAVLEADIDPTHVGATRHGENGAPPLPWWGVSLTLGVESEVL
jgi:hypothetical protein